ncbi:uncharacterized protein LOC144200404 [Stigmatopora nigra]
MRLTWSTMLQHNNNNNHHHPCLKASPHEAPLKRPPRPLPGKLELGLGDLPLIRGLRAWVLCSKNRQKADGRAPATPPAARRTSCARPADVRFGGGDWASGYGLPNAGVGAGVGALVTVATLQTSEGAGKTQTRCLFLRNDKGTCLYSTSGGTGGPGGWPRGKPAPGRREPSALQPQTAAGRVRLRSGRRWRKSGHPGAWDKRPSDEDIAREQDKVRPVPKGGSSRKQPGPKGLQNPSDVDSPGKETVLDEDVTVKREEPEQKRQPLESQKGSNQDKRPQEVPDTECQDFQSPKERTANVRTPFDDITPTGWRDEARRPAGGTTEQAGGHLGTPDADPQSEKKPSLEFSGGKSLEGNPEADGMPEELLRQSMGRGAGARLRIPAPGSPPSGTMATGQQRVGVQEEEEKVRRDDKEQEEDDFGGFVQADDGEDGVPEDLLLSETAASEAWPDWEPGWTESPDAWATFPRDEARDWAGRWWPQEEESDEGNVVDGELARMFTSAFPSPPTSATNPSDDVVPTLTQLLAESGGREQRLLDVFRDVSKMSVRRYKRGRGVSPSLLLSSLGVCE